MTAILRQRLLVIPSLVWVCALVAACLLPFSDKAFHIDDILFLRAGQHIRHHPLDFYGFNMNWYGATRPMVENFDNPPLACYYLALVSALAGWGEPALHLSFLLPALAAACGIFSLARRHAASPVWATVMAVLTPVFLISATTVMCDVMLVAFWVWTVALFDRGLEANQPCAFMASGVLAALAFLTKFTGLALFPLLLAYGLVKQRRFGWWLATPLILLFVAALYQATTQLLYGKGLLLTAVGVSSHAGKLHGEGLFERQVLGLSYVGGCFLPMLFYVPWLWSRRGLIGLLILTAPCLLAFPYLPRLATLLWQPDGRPDWLLCLQSTVFVTSGVHIFLLAAAECWEQRDATTVLLLLWVLGILLFATTLNWTLNGRSVLPMAPAIAILAARRLQRRCQAQQAAIPSSLLWPALAAGLLSLTLAKADCDLADTGRTAALTLCTNFQHPGKRLWFEGHWGFQYYMEQGGAKPLESNFAQATAGDVVIVPSENVNIFDLATNLVRLSETLEYRPNTCCSTMNLAVGAGFYAGTAGPFPFSISRPDPECYYIFEVLQKLTAPSPAPEGLFVSGAVMQQFDLARQARFKPCRIAPNVGHRARDK
ncbi:MAG TPA: glycosyltransferase family 39 protein [Candidatus Acidoferrum sp.]|nr:glycosyltransferase family 39 protein [Candidatus Acidoferrum sp.]